nr:NUDIX domain-containing protein [Kibdelosporangium phytohabitans]
MIARAVIRRDNRVLLARERSARWFFLPGGHVEPGERVEVALLRELDEELGTGATIERFLALVEYGYVSDGVAHHEVNVVFEVGIADPDPVGQEEHIEFHWLPLDRLADADVRPHPVKDVFLPGVTPFWRAWPGRTA